MINRWIILTAVMLFLTACGESSNSSKMTPDETYREYYQRVIEGISAEDGKSYHSNAFTQKLETRIKAAQQNSSNSTAEFMAIYFQRQQSSAKCNSIALESEIIDGEIANLVYHSKSTCPEKNNIQDTKDEIRMVYENGWKIDHIAFTAR